MSYIGSWKIDDLVTFYAQTQSFTTGTAVDADSAPSYRVYENETGTPLLTGSMATLDAGNTDGFYSEQITLSAANGFEKGQCYSVRIQATVDGVTSASIREFQIEADVSTNSLTATAANTVNAQVLDVLSVDTFAEPTGVPPATDTVSNKIGRLYQALRNGLTVTGSAKTFQDDAGASLWKKPLSDDGTTYTEGEGTTP